MPALHARLLVFGCLLFAACEIDPLARIDTGVVLPPDDRTPEDPAPDAGEPPPMEPPLITTDAGPAAPDAGPAAPDAEPAAPDAEPAPITPDAGEPAPDAAPSSEPCPLGPGSNRVYATLNPADRQQDIRLDRGDLLVETTTFNDTVRATTGKRGGRWYWEVTLEALSGTYHRVGVATRALNLELSPGGDDLGCGYQTSGDVECAFRATTTRLAPAVAGDIIGVALDLDARRIYFSVNGTWPAAHDPTNGTGGLDIGWDPACEAIYPALNVSIGDKFLANFGAQTFAHPVPAGYNAGWFDDPICPADTCGSSSSQPMSCTLVTDPAQVTIGYPASTPLAGVCNSGTPSNYTNQFIPGCFPSELHIVSVYEGTSGGVSVLVKATAAPVTLMLSSYESISWNVTLDPGARVDGVFIHGYHPSAVSGLPAGTPITNFSTAAAPSPIQSYSYGWEPAANAGGANYQNFIASIRSVTQFMEVTYQGCYEGRFFRVPY